MNITALNDAIHSLISQPGTALLAGVLAAFTPCTITIIPILLYRLGIWGGDNPDSAKVDRSWKRTLTETLMLTVAFMTSFILTGAAFQMASNSQYANVTKLGLGMLLVLAALLLLAGRLRIQSLLRVSHPVTLGLTLPLVVSLSPCVIPFVSALLSTHAGTGGILRFFLFGLGVLLPGVLIGLVGNQLVAKVRWFSRSIGKIEALSPFLLGLTGLYMGTNLIGVTKGDVYITSIFLGLITLGFAYNILIKYGYLTVMNVIWAAAVGTVALVMVSFSAAAAPATDPLSGMTFIIACSADFMPSLKHFEVIIPLVIWMAALCLWYIVSSRPSGNSKVQFTGLISG